MFRFSKGRAIAMVPTNHLKTEPFKILTFLSGFKMFFDKMAAICLNLKWLGFLDFRSHSKSRPSANQPLLDHSKLKLVRISNPHWTGRPKYGLIRKPDFLMSVAQMVTCRAKYQTKCLRFKIVSVSRLLAWIWDTFRHFE